MEKQWFTSTRGFTKINRRSVRVAFLLSLLLLLAASTVRPSLARADAPPPRLSREVTVEATRTSSQGSVRLLSATLLLEEGSRPARLDLQKGDVAYHLGISCEDARDSTATVRLDLGWKQGGPAAKRPGGGPTPRRSTSISMASRVSLARRVLLGTVLDPDGSELQIHVTLKEATPPAPPAGVRR